jgi:hypothetical protein
MGGVDLDKDLWIPEEVNMKDKNPTGVDWRNKSKNQTWGEK